MTGTGVAAADQELAVRLVSEAGALAQRLRAEGLAADSKTSVSDIVTAADRAAEELVHGELRTWRPADSVLGEEGTSYDGSSARRWVIDPVDGTYNFFNNLDWWCSALALTENAEPLLGAVHNPATGTTWLGGPDLPSTRNGRPLPAKDDFALAEVAAATYLHPVFYNEPAVREPWLRAAAGTATVRMFGSGSMDLCAVASGSIGVWFQHSVPAWDWLPGSSIVRGVGGVAEQIEVNGFTWSVAGGSRAVASVIAALTG